ncbi:hypothetical protein V7796_26555 [Rhizobium laguerreae]
MAVPMGWHVTGYLMAGILIVVLIFLSIASYSRIVTATGIIQPDKGVAIVMPSRSGVIMKMMVADGDQVEEGQELVAVRSEDYLVSGESASEKVAEMLDRQNASISEQLAEVKNDEIAQTAQFGAQIAGYQTQIDKLQSQIALQRELITSIEKDVERIRGLVDKGIVPRRDVTLREDLAHRAAPANGGAGKHVDGTALGSLRCRTNARSGQGALKREGRSTPVAA